jgi:hypothetical protein
VLDGLLKDQVKGDPEIAGMLTKYKGIPAFFFQKAPMDTDRGWDKSCYPRVDYNIDMRCDPERKAAGTMVVNVWCTSESAYMPEDIEKRLIALIDDTFYTNRQRATVCAIWHRSDAFDFERSTIVGRVTPEAFGVSISFDLMEFPDQLTTDPDPIQSLNKWTRENFPGMTVIAHDDMPPVWKPTDTNPAIYWRFDGMTATDRQSYAVNWYTGQFAAHVITQGVTERNRWTKAMIELIQLEGEIPLVDGSPMFAKQISIRHSADPLREGQLLLTGQYGVLAQHRKERARIPLNRAVIPNLTMEVSKYGKDSKQ